MPYTAAYPCARREASRQQEPIWRAQMCASPRAQAGDADAVDRSGLRLRLLKQQANAGDITLLFGDEAEALTPPYLAHAGAQRGEDLRVEAPGRAPKRAILGGLDFATRRVLVNTSATKRSRDFIALLGRLDAAYGPCPAHGSSPWAEGPRPQRPVILVLDNGPIHTSKASRAAPSTSSGGRAPVAQDRMAAEICSGAERHRAILARPEVSLSRAPDLLRSRSSRPCRNLHAKSADLKDMLVQ